MSSRLNGLAGQPVDSVFAKTLLFNHRLKITDQVRDCVVPDVYHQVLTEIRRNLGVFQNMVGIPRHAQHGYMELVRHSW